MMYTTKNSTSQIIDRNKGQASENVNIQGRGLLGHDAM